MTIQTAKASDSGVYLLGPPANAVAPSLWGLPVGLSAPMPQGKFLVLSRAAATIYDREDASVLASTEDRDNFIKNMVTLLGEERVALGVSAPNAARQGIIPVAAPGDAGTLRARR